MAKKKTSKPEEQEAVSESEKPSIWQQIVESVTDANKDTIKNELSTAAKFLEGHDGDKELIEGIKAALKRIG